MPGLTYSNGYLQLTDDEGNVIPRQRDLTIVSNLNEPIEARVTLYVDSVDKSIEEVELEYVGEESERL